MRTNISSIRVLLFSPIFWFLHPPCNAHDRSHEFGFIENKGQWEECVRFVADLPEGKLVLKQSGISYQLRNPITGTEQEKFLKMHTASLQEYTTINVDFEGYNEDVVLSGSDPSKVNYHYYFGNDPTHWAENCKSYASVRYHDVYNGVDLVFYISRDVLKYDLILASGASVERIQFQYSGDLDQVFLEDGCSFVETPAGTLMENRPLAYQHSLLGKSKINCSYKLSGNRLRFDLGDYDATLPLVIDPELIFSTFSGSASDNFGYTACYDDSGSLYSGGIVFGSNFPATTGSYSGGSDMAILKYDSSGSDLMYATFIGGNSGDSPHTMVVNDANELVIMGTTGSSNFPTSANAYDRTFNGGTSFNIFDKYTNGVDIAVVKLDEQGRISASTYVGSSGNDGILSLNAIGNYNNRLIYNYGDYQRGDVNVDGNGNVYVASSTDSGDFPNTSTIQSNFGGGTSDAVAFMLNSDFSQLKWSVFLGGSGDDAAYSVKITDEGYIALGGGTASDDFPVTMDALQASYSGSIDGFISLIDPEGDSILHSTFLGTNSYDQVYFIDIDSSQNIYATGQTSGSYPVTSGVYSNSGSSQFIHKLYPNLSETVFSTVIGNGAKYPNISPTAFLASECGNIFLSGWGGTINSYYSTYSHSAMSGLPVTSNALYPTTDGSDFYLISLSSDASQLLYGTFYGSTNNGGDHVDGGTSRFDKRGIVYQSACSCGGSDDDFPVTSGAWSTTNNGVNSSGIERCNNASFKFDMASIDAKYITSEIDGSNEGILIGCLPFTVLFTNQSTGGVEFTWYVDDEVISTNSDTVIYTFDETGSYVVTLLVRDENTCQVEDVYVQTLVVFEDEVEISDSTQICYGSEVTLTASGGISYLWSTEDGLDKTTGATLSASPEETTTYTVEITTPNGCVKELSVKVEVIPNVTVDYEIEANYSCGQQITYHVQNNTEYEGKWLWLFGDGQQSTDTAPNFTYEQDGTYTVSSVLDYDCVVVEEEEVHHVDVFVPNVFTPNNDGKNEFFEIETALSVDLVVLDRNGKEVFSAKDYQNDWSGEGFSAGTYFYVLTFPGNEICKGWLQLMR